MNKLEEIKKFYNSHAELVSNDGQIHQKNIFQLDDYFGWLIRRVERLEGALRRLQRAKDNIDPPMELGKAYWIVDEALAEEEK